MINLYPLYIVIYKYNLIPCLTSDSPMCTKGLKYTDDEFVNDLQEKNIGGYLCKNEIINLYRTEELQGKNFIFFQNTYQKALPPLP